MEPFVVVIVLIVFSTFGLSLKMILDYRRESLGLRQTKTSAGIGSSELRHLIQEAVDEAVQPLVHRLEEAEKQRLLDAPREHSDEG